jgi:CubicO group peptidase (beta-lactamase class C family)
MRITMRALVHGTCLTAVCALALTAQAPRQLVGFDSVVARGMKTFDVPGVALAIVKGDSVVYVKGYGTRTLGKNEPVDDRTMFAIGSSSKAFTAATLAMLVDEKKVRWDDPVTKYLPFFQMYDPYVSRELTVRDLLTHRSGLSRGDLLWYGTAWDRNEIIRRVRYLKPTYSVRATFSYQNIMYLTAGQVAAVAGGKTWDDMVHDRIFVPLGMSATNTSTRALTGQGDVATPHMKIDDTVRAISYRNIDNIGPAGSINSNVRDMAQWVRFQLDSGRAAGKALIATTTFVETHTPQTIIRVDSAARRTNPFTHFSSYGFGWFLQDYRGREIVHHGGNIDGMSALVAMMPEERLGLVVLTNANGSPLPSTIMYSVFDRYLGAQGMDWVAHVGKIVEGQQKQAKDAQKALEAQRVAGTSASLALDKYAGTYADSMYGDAVVALENGHLVMKVGAPLAADLEHWHYNTFRAVARDKTMGKLFVNFALASDGKVASMKIDGLTEFMRRPAPPDTSKRASR